MNENAIPELTLLSEEQITKIHENSIRILKDTGIKIESQTAQKIFLKSDDVQIKDNIVYLNSDLVEACIQTAPSQIDVYTKEGNPAFQLGNKNKTYFGIGVTNTHFQEIETNKIKDFTREHSQICTKLGDILPAYDMISTLGIPSDTDTHKLDLFNALDIYANTSKALVLLINETSSTQKVFELLNELHGDISAKPFILSYVNPITPLILNEATTEKMMISIQNGIPVIFSNYAMYGATTPITEGGTLALLNAELLAGLVFSQLVKKASPIVLGSLPAAFNMVSMGSVYTASSYLLNVACAEMMEHYSIPHCGTSGSGKAWTPDIIATGEYWLNHFTNSIGKSDMVPFIGGNLDSLAFSPVNVVLSNYIIQELRKFAKGFSIGDESKNSSEIQTIGHGGDYLTSPQTLEAITNFNDSNKIWPSFNLDSWRAAGEKKKKKYLIEHSLELYENAKKLSKGNDDLIRKGEEIIQKLP